MSEELSLSTAVSTTLSVLPNAAFVLPCLAGCVTFGSVLSASTLTQLKVFGLSTGSIRPLPTMAGVISVAIASLASHSASTAAYRVINKDPLATVRLPFSSDENPLRFGSIAVPKQSIQVCAFGLIVFKLLGGRFWAISPSSFTHLGSFARVSIPATDSYATSQERALIQRLGKFWGCHTCGSRVKSHLGLPNFHSDHMPPKAVAQQMDQQLWRRLLGLKTKFRFFPQCVSCSNIQGNILASATRELRQASKWWNRPNLSGSGGGKLSHFHGFRFRVNHLTGSVIAGATVLHASDFETRNGNLGRLEKLYDDTAAALSNTIGRIPDMMRNTNLPKRIKKMNDE